jgi:serine/threonine protein kinase
MIRRFDSRVNIALHTKDSSLLARIYSDAESLPRTETQKNWRLDGYVIDGCLGTGGDDLQICFKDSVPSVLKVLAESEYNNALRLETAMKQPVEQKPSEFLISFDLKITRKEKSAKYYMIMPMFPITLESLPKLSPTALDRLVKQIGNALSYMHDLHFAHMDVKPSNILISPSGDFILADLGSVSPYGSRTRSTRPFLPTEMWVNDQPPLASDVVDWWMLAMTVGDKFCHFNCGCGSSDYSMNYVKNKLIEECAHISVYIESDLIPKLTDLPGNSNSALPVVPSMVSPKRSVLIDIPNSNSKIKKKKRKLASDHVREGEEKQGFS